MAVQRIREAKAEVRHLYVIVAFDFDVLGVPKNVYQQLHVVKVELRRSILTSCSRAPRMQAAKASRQ